MPKSSTSKRFSKTMGGIAKETAQKFIYKKKFAFLIAPENVARIHLFFHIGKAFVVAVGNDGF